MELVQDHDADLTHATQDKVGFPRMNIIYDATVMQPQCNPSAMLTPTLCNQPNSPHAGPLHGACHDTEPDATDHLPDLRCNKQSMQADNSAYHIPYLLHTTKANDLRNLQRGTNSKLEF